MMKKIQAVLYSAGVFQHYYGYNYFQKAVLLAVENPERLQSIRKEIYFPIALEYNTTIVNVERDLRTVRDALIKNGGLDTLENLLGCPLWSGRKLCPKELISIFAAYLSESCGT